MPHGRLFAGTSGFAYRQWKPGFYPADLKSTEMLAYYAGRLTSVEINNTFYRMPAPKLLEDWQAKVPETFVFSLKAPRRITHVQRLRDSAEAVGFFLRSAQVLGDSLGCLLFQCPPSLRYDRERLDAFLATLPRPGTRVAMEFRHDSWRDPEVTARLREQGIALCCVEDGEAPAVLERTAPDFVYLRLRKPEYGPAELETWAKRLRELLDDGIDAYVYLKHEDDPAGAHAAERLLDLTSPKNRKKEEKNRG